MIIILAIINSILLVLGQTLFKIGANKIDNLSLNMKSLMSIISNKHILSGIVIYGFTTLLWIYLLSKEDLSRLYPTQSLAFVFAMIASLLVFKEDVGLNRWLGTAIICIGIYVCTYK